MLRDELPGGEHPLQAGPGLPRDPGRHPGDPGRHPGDPGQHPGDPGRHPGDPGRHPGDPQHPQCSLGPCCARGSTAP